MSAVGSAYDTVEAEVRELGPRRGLDPVQDRAAVRRLVDEVVTEYDERSLIGSLPPLSDSAAAARAVYDSVAGFWAVAAEPRRPDGRGDLRQVAADHRVEPPHGGFCKDRVAHM